MTGNIFINYRRSGDWSYARLLFGELEKKYPPKQIFMDVDSITPGEDFVRLLNEKVAQSDIFLAVIGPAWLEARDKDNRRRLDDPGDFVRIEIEQALKTAARVIPLLVDGATMPDPRALPESMRGLCNRNALRLSQDRFGTDAQQLIATIERAIAALDDDRAWEKATRDGSQKALQGYLSAFTDGRHAQEARQRLRQISVTIPGGTNDRNSGAVSSLVQLALPMRSPRFFLALCTIGFVLAAGTLTPSVETNAEGGQKVFYEWGVSSLLCIALLIAGALFTCWQMLTATQEGWNIDETHGAIGMKTWMFGVILPFCLLLSPIFLYFLNQYGSLPEDTPLHKWPFSRSGDILANVWFYPYPLAWFAAVEAQRVSLTQSERLVSMAYSAATILTLTAFCMIFLIIYYAEVLGVPFWSILAANYSSIVLFLHKTASRLPIATYLISASSLLVPHLFITITIASLSGIVGPSAYDLIPVCGVSLIAFVLVAATIWWLRSRRRAFG